MSYYICHFGNNCHNKNCNRFHIPSYMKICPGTSNLIFLYKIRSHQNVYSHVINNIYEYISTQVCKDKYLPIFMIYIKLFM